MEESARNVMADVKNAKLWLAVMNALEGSSLLVMVSVRLVILLIVNTVQITNALTVKINGLSIQMDNVIKLVMQVTLITLQMADVILVTIDLNVSNAKEELQHNVPDVNLTTSNTLKAARNVMTNVTLVKE